MAVLSIVVSLFLGVLKVSLGAFAQSASVVADGLESFAIAIGAIFVVAGLKFGRKPADRDFPYGYGRIEFLVSVVSYAGLFGLGLFMAIGSGLLLMDGRFSGPKLISLPVSAISVVATLLLYSALQCAGRSTGSAGLLAGAQQNLADTLTSVGVLISVALAQLGPSFYWCDSLGAGVVGLMIMKGAAGSWWLDIRVLMDTSLPQDRLRQIRAVVNGVEGVVWTSFVKARRTGQGVWVALGVQVPPERSIAKAQQVSTDARAAVLRRLNWVKEIDIYVYPAKNTLSRSMRNVAGLERIASQGRLSCRDSASSAH